MTKAHKSYRIDSEIIARVKAYAVKENLSESAAVAKLLEQGLEVTFNGIAQELSSGKDTTKETEQAQLIEAQRAHIGDLQKQLTDKEKTIDALTDQNANLIEQTAKLTDQCARLTEAAANWSTTANQAQQLHAITELKTLETNTTQSTQEPTTKKPLFERLKQAIKG